LSAFTPITLHAAPCDVLVALDFGKPFFRLDRQDSGGQGGLAVVDVTDGPDVDVNLLHCRKTASLTGRSPYSEKVPNVDEGFTKADVFSDDFKDGGARREAICKVIRSRLAKAQKERLFGYLVREAPAEDVKDLQKVAGHLQENWFITKFRKIFTRDELNDDLAMVPARYNEVEDTSEYEEILPSSPP
jgi:hypothetical protein